MAERGLTIGLRGAPNGLRGAPNGLRGAPNVLRGAPNVLRELGREAAGKIICVSLPSQLYAGPLTGTLSLFRAPLSPIGAPPSPFAVVYQNNEQNLENKNCPKVFPPKKNIIFMFFVRGCS